MSKPLKATIHAVCLGAALALGTPGNALAVEPTDPVVQALEKKLEQSLKMID